MYDLSKGMKEWLEGQKNTSLKARKYPHLKNRLHFMRNICVRMDGSASPDTSPINMILDLMKMQVNGRTFLAHTFLTVADPNTFLTDLS